MKNLFFSVLAMIIFIIFTSCSKSAEPVNNELPYYSFKEADREKILPYVENQVIKFKNEDGTERNFKVSLSESFPKVLYGVGMGFFGGFAATYFYYDSKAIEFQSYPDSVFAFSVTFSKWPLTTEFEDSDKRREYPSAVRGFILFSYWNGVKNENERELNIPINFNVTKNRMTINGRQYNKVATIISNNKNPLSNIYNVNVIYYDEKEGIVGFDDLNNHQWRLVN